MISPHTALGLVLRHCTPRAARRHSLTDALGLVLAEDVRAPMALPSFDNSSMDGYAVRARDTVRAKPGRPVQLRIAGLVHAGETRSRTLRAGEAIAIATGARLPSGSDAVVPVEDVRANGNQVLIASPVPRWRYVRRRGEEIRPGARILSRGSVLHAGALGSLGAVGRGHVRAVPLPRVTVITTGDETVLPGRKLATGRVYDSNVVMLDALLRQSGIMPLRLLRVRDDPAALSRALSGSLSQSDVVITVGGVSVGRRDYVRATLREIGVRPVFWGVAQQPGKPLYFGRRRHRLVFGLPGNPASAFVCFCLYVQPALRALAGHRAPSPVLEHRVLRKAVRTDPGRWRLLRGRVAPGASRIDVFSRQGSHMTTPLAHASHLVFVPPGTRRKTLPAGSRVVCVRLAHVPETHR